MILLFHTTLPFPDQLWLVDSDVLHIELRQKYILFFEISVPKYSFSSIQSIEIIQKLFVDGILCNTSTI